MALSAAVIGLAALPDGVECVWPKPPRPQRESHVLDCIRAAGQSHYDYVAACQSGDIHAVSEMLLLPKVEAAEIEKPTFC